MGSIDDTYTFFLKIYFNGEEEPILLKVRKKETKRFKNNITAFNEDNGLILFFVSNTIDGKYVGINLSQIQAANILWEPTPYVEDSKHYEGPIKLLLRNRKEFIETYTEDPDELYDFYGDLEHGPDVVGSFVGFTDEDGEELLININELLYIESPRSLTDEGWTMVKKRDGIDA
jgi:hypothetical protein